MTVKILSGFAFSYGIKMLWEGNATRNKSHMNIIAVSFPR